GGTVNDGGNIELYGSAHGAADEIKYNATTHTWNDATAEPLILMTLDSAGALVLTSTLTINSISAGVADYDKFLVSDTGEIKYRSGTQVLSDIGAALKAIEDQRWADSSEQRQDLRDACDGYGAVGAHSIASHSDTTGTGAELNSLTDNSIVNALHRHSELVASDGSPDPAIYADAAGKLICDNDLQIGGDLQVTGQDIFRGTTNDELHLSGGTHANGGQILLFGSTDPSYPSDIRYFATDHKFYDVGGANQRMTIEGSTGDVGIGEVSPGYRLSVTDNVANYVARFFNDGNINNHYGIRIQCGPDTATASGYPRWAALTDGNGSNRSYIGYKTTTPYAAFISASDERLKKNILPTKVNGLDIINRLELYEFDWKGELEVEEGMQATKLPSQKISYIAQQVQQIYPEMISEDEDGTLMLEDSSLIVILVKAVQELTARVAELEASK
ncbi:hypothetical protein LCGC14_1483830, partial [marine sediment metagenome]